MFWRLAAGSWPRSWVSNQGALPARLWAPSQTCCSGADGWASLLVRFTAARASLSHGPATHVNLNSGVCGEVLCRRAAAVLRVRRCCNTSSIMYQTLHLPGISPASHTIWTHVCEQCLSVRAKRNRSPKWHRHGVPTASLASTQQLGWHASCFLAPSQQPQRCAGQQHKFSPGL